MAGWGSCTRPGTEALRRLVALKMILAGGFASEAQRQRFRREAELAARVQHPNIVQVYDVGVHDGRPFLAMEWAGGGTLADRLGGDPWPPHDAARLVETLAQAIDAAHRRGVVHRDLKPSNILLASDADGSVAGPLGGAIPKVADFGLALAQEGGDRLTCTGQALGTPEYMAPEQAAGTAVGPKADVYALGALLYHLLAGQPPFRGVTPMEVLQALTSAEPVAPSRFRPRLPRDLETVTLKAIEKDPARRYATAGKLAEDLRRFLEGMPVAAHRAGARASGAVGAAPAGAGSAGRLARRRDRACLRRNHGAVARCRAGPRSRPCGRRRPATRTLSGRHRRRRQRGRAQQLRPGARLARLGTA